MLAVLVVVADLGTALVPVITAVVVFWVAGLERRYMLRVGAARRRRWSVVGRVVASRYRVARIIAYFDPDYSKIEMIDTHGWIAIYISAVDHRARRRAISRASPRSRSAPAECSASA